MRIWRRVVPCLFLVIASVVTGAATEYRPQPAVVIGPQAPALERYAADQLCSYLSRLYRIEVRPTSVAPAGADALFLIGTPSSNPLIKQATRRQAFPQVSEQGIVIRRAQLHGTPVLIVGGGGPRAALWAVYELAERWGVRYFLHGDVLPKPAGTFALPNQDVVLEPNLPIRQWRIINSFAHGPESWGMADYRPLIDQLAKLKFNRLYLDMWVYNPFVDFQLRGIKRRTSKPFIGWHYPITDDMVGRELFGKEKEFWNPDWPLTDNYEEMHAAHQRWAQNLIDYAHARGMEAGMTVTLSDFLPEFAPLLKEAKTINQAGELTMVPGEGTPADDPLLQDLAGTILRTAINTYPAVDFIVLIQPEHRQWLKQYEMAWKALDTKYGISKNRTLADALARAERRTTYPGGAERAVREVKGDIVGLYFYDRLFREQQVMKTTRRPDVKLVFCAIAEELYPILGKVLPPGSEALMFMDYTASRVLQRPEGLKDFPTSEVPATFIYTLEDDNIGTVPQLTTSSLHEITLDLRRYGWKGFSSRYWMLDTHDPSATYMSRAAWDTAVTPVGVFRDYAKTVCGNACVDDMLVALHEYEVATKHYELPTLYGVSFPVPDLMKGYWSGKAASLPMQVVAAREAYQRALDAAAKAQARANGAAPKELTYLMGRLEYGIEYINCLEAAARAGSAEAASHKEEAIRQGEEAVTHVRKALEAQARVARDQSDRGTVAVMNEYVYRWLKNKLAELKKEPTP